MAHAQKPDFVFRANRTSPFKSAGVRQFSLLAAEVCTSAVVMLDTPCSEVVWRVLATHSIHHFPFHFPSHASQCAITFQPESTTICTHNVTYMRPRQLVGNSSQFQYRATPSVALPEYTLPLRSRSKLYSKVHQCLSLPGDTCMSSRPVVNISKNHVLLPCASKPKISTNKRRCVGDKRVNSRKQTAFWFTTVQTEEQPHSMA